MDIEQSKAVLVKSNPLRADLPWLVILSEGIIIGGIGLYAVLAEESAQRNIVFLIGVFLFLNGISAIYAAVRDRRELDSMTPFSYFRAGVALSTGTIVIVNRFNEFMSLKAARTIVGAGLISIGIVAILGLIAISRTTEFRPAAYVLPAILTILGVVAIYQAANDNNTSKLIGWVALLIGIGLVGLAFLRRQQQEAASTASSAPPDSPPAPAA